MVLAARAIDFEQFYIISSSAKPHQYLFRSSTAIGVSGSLQHCLQELELKFHVVNGLRQVRAVTNERPD